MDFDHLAGERSNTIFAVWLQQLCRNSPEHLAADLAKRHRPGTPSTASRYGNGAFNFCYRVTYEDRFRALVRFTALGRVTFRNEKVEDEVAVMRFLAENTSIPVPEVLGSGKCWLGPYIVMTIVEGRPLSEYLCNPLEKERLALNPNISSSSLKMAYHGMANIMLELSKHSFSCIGGLRQDECNKAWVVNKRPLTFNMNRLAQFSNYPPHGFATQTFADATDYFAELAAQQLRHLEFQRNDAVTDSADCQKKYIARCLFQKIIHKISEEHGSGPFRLFCDDFNPSNILIDVSRLSVTGVIDWEFTYAAPAAFSHAAPWWLLLERPEEWESDLTAFLLRYRPRFHVFLAALRDCEAEKMRDGTLLDSQRLSEAMATSLDDGLFWVCLAMRHSSMFDEIYWAFIDQKYYGSFSTVDDRIGELTEREQGDLDVFVQRKIQQAEEARLEIHQDLDDLINL